MGRDLYEGSAAARSVFDIADRVLGYALSTICFEGPEEQATRDRVHPAGDLRDKPRLPRCRHRKRQGHRQRPAFMAGHSLGEYSALVAAGAMSLEDGLPLLAERARLMAEAGRATTGRMAAIIGLDEDAVRAICNEADVDVCNLNLPNQTVIGGTPEARRESDGAGEGAWRVAGPWSLTSAAPSTAA